MQKIKLDYIAINKIAEFGNNARTHSDSQVEQIAGSIREFGFTNPILIDEANTIIAGHGRFAAAKMLGLDKVPCIRLTHLSERQRRAYILADNKLAMNAGWDFEKLAEELSYLAETEYDLTLTGFAEDELDALLKADESLLPGGFGSPETITVSEHQRKVGKDQVNTGLTEDDKAPEPQPSPVSKKGDVFIMGNHRLMCGDSTSAEDISVLMVGKKADMVFTDPPYNVKISGLGTSRLETSIGSKHGEFVMASGEMSVKEFTDFLRKVFKNLVDNSKDGAIHYVCMDWRHMLEVLNASDSYGDNLRALKQLIVWNKDRGGMGTFYRSKHEMIFVFKVGNGKHTNNFELGQHGRYRTNVWDYPMVLTFMHNASEGEGNSEMHPTVKPVVMIVDACLDCSKDGEIVLDLFGGSGSTTIACEKTGRHSRLMELDPKYVDVIVKRWQDFTGKIAIHEQTGKTFSELTNERNN